MILINIPANKWAYMTKGDVVDAYAYFIVTVVFIIWLIVTLSKAEEIQKEIKNELQIMNERLEVVIKEKVGG